MYQHQLLSASSIPLFIFLIAFSLKMNMVSGQEIRGYVLDANTKTPLEGAVVKVSGTFAGGIADSSGAFVIRHLKAGGYTLICRIEGYASKSREVYLGKDAPTILAFAMTEQPFSLSEAVVITARRSEERLYEIPEAMSVMDQAELAERMPRSLPDGMMSMPGVWMQKTNHGGGSAFIRGLTGNQTLLLVDGIRLNNATYRYGPNQYLNTIDPFSIARIEVLRGSGSVQYGSDALGGVIQLLSKEAVFSSEGLETDIALSAKYMSADMEKSVRGSWQLATPRLSVRMGISYKDFGDLLAGGNLGIQAPSGYRELDADFKAVVRLGTQQRLSFVWQQVDQREVGRYDQVAQRGYQLYQFDPQQRQLGYLRWERAGDAAWMRNLRLTLSTQYSNEERDKRKVESETIRHEQDEISTLGLSLEHSAQPLPAWQMNSGIELYYDDIASIAHDMDLTDSSRIELRGLYPDGASSTNASVYSLHTVTLSSLTWRAGLRYNIFQLSAFDIEFGKIDLNPQALVGHLAATLELGEHHHVTAQVQTGFRAPNINDLSSFGSFDSGIEVPSPDLASEQTLTGEFVYKVRHERIAASLAIYQTQLFNLITRIPGTYQGSNTYEGEPVFQKANVDEALIRGLEIEGDVALHPQVKMYSMLSYTHGQTLEDEPQPLRRIPPVHGLTGLRWMGEQGLGARIDFRYAGRQDRLSAGDISDHRIANDGTPSWQVVDAYLNYRWNALYVRAGFQNLFNQAYRMHGSGIDGLGRSVWLALEWTL